MENKTNVTFSISKLDAACFILNEVTCSLGIVTNLLSALILANMKIENMMFKYMLSISISDIFYSIFIFIDNYLDYFFPKSYLKNVFDIIFSEYLTSCIAIFIVQMDLYFSIQRCMIVVNRTFLKMFSFMRLLIVLNLISFVYYLPFLGLYRIELQSDDVYITKLNDFGKSKIGRIVPIILTSIRLLILLVIIPSVNGSMCFYLCKQMKKKNSHFMSKTIKSNVLNYL